MPESIRWGLVSTAHINQSVIPAIRASRRSQLTAVASRSLEQARAYAAQWEIPRAFGSYEAMLSDPEIDAVYISLPNSLHSEWAVKAMQAGKHVLCEKPLATTLPDVDAIIAAQRQTGMAAAEAFMYRHHPQTLKVREIVASGALGTVQLLRGSFTFRLTNPANIRLNADLHGGSLWDIGCYPLSYTRTALGLEPEEMFAWQVTASSGVDESLCGTLRFPGNIYAQILCSFNSPYSAGVEILGDAGQLYIPDPYKPGTKSEIILRRDGQTEVIPVESQELYVGEVEDLVDTILTGKAPRVSLSDSRNNVAAILALLESARQNRPVQLSAIG